MKSLYHFRILDACVFKNVLKLLAFNQTYLYWGGLCSDCSTRLTSLIHSICCSLSKEKRGGILAMQIYEAQNLFKFFVVLSIDLQISRCVNAVRFPITSTTAVSRSPSSSILAFEANRKREKWSEKNETFSASNRTPNFALSPTQLKTSQSSKES